jgi:hypothetical protein
MSQHGTGHATGLADLAAIEAIRQVKYRYFRALDCNEWDLFAGCLTEDCAAAYSGGKLRLDGRDAIVAFMRNNMSGADFLSMHHGHHPEIVVESATEASGTWYLEDTIISLARRTRLSGAAIYEDRYRCENGEWRISSTGYRRTFEFVEPLNPEATLLSNMFDVPPGQAG